MYGVGGVGVGLLVDPLRVLPVKSPPWGWVLGVVESTARGFIDVSSANLFHFPALCVKIYGTRTRKYVALLIEIYWAITDDRPTSDPKFGHIYIRIGTVGALF